MGISLENHSSPTENSKKTHLPQRKTLKTNRKLKEKFFEFFSKIFRNFSKIFSKIFLKVTGNFFEIA